MNGEALVKDMHTGKEEYIDLSVNLEEVKRRISQVVEAIAKILSDKFNSDGADKIRYLLNDNFEIYHFESKKRRKKRKIWYQRCAFDVKYFWGKMLFEIYTYYSILMGWIFTKLIIEDKENIEEIKLKLEQWLSNLGKEFILKEKSLVG